MQHGVDGDESERDFGELTVQQHASEQCGRTEGMTCQRIRNEEPQRHDESSEESTRHAMHDHCLCGSPHLPDLAKRATDNMAARAGTVYWCIRSISAAPRSASRLHRR